MILIESVTSVGLHFDLRFTGGQSIFWYGSVEHLSFFFGFRLSSSLYQSLDARLSEAKFDSELKEMRSSCRLGACFARLLSRMKTMISVPILI